MPTRIPKESKNKSQSLTNTSSQKQGESMPIFQFRDNRTEMVAQRKLQETSNNSNQVNRLNTVQLVSNKTTLKGKELLHKTNSNSVIQRALDLSTLSRTQNNLYYTVVGGSTKLISKATAPAPEPKTLYNKESKRAINGDELFKWTPRSKFADKKKLSGETPVHSATGEVLKKYNDVEDHVLGELMAEVDNDINNRQGDTGLRLGTAGMNDCKGYATTLKAMIAKYGDNPQGLVGKSWLHETKPDKASFPYHGATVVAQDGADAVTLEAHAGQELAVPKFHIRRGGKTGFESANKASHPGQYKDSASESGLMSIANANHVLNALKTAWHDPTQRSDKSAVKESAPIPAPGRNWKLIGTLLVAAIGAIGAVIGIARLDNNR